MSPDKVGSIPRLIPGIISPMSVTILKSDARKRPAIRWDIRNDATSGHKLTNLLLCGNTMV